MNVWELIIQQPLTNILIVVSSVFGGNFGAAIIILTILVNLAMLPLTLSQIRSARKMQELQPRLAEIQKKYSKDRQRLAQEQMKLYKESGIKPAGCALTMIIQMPVWIALYQSIMLALAAVPEGLLNLARYLYPWGVVFSSLPMNPYFLGMNLAQPNIIMAVLVGVSMWIQQKMSQTPSADPASASSSQMMVWLMPMLFTFLALSFPSGLALYWVASSLFRIILQYRISGWGSLRKSSFTGIDSKQKYVTFEGEDTKKAKAKKVKPKEEIMITDKESLKKSSKKPSRFAKFFQGEDEDNSEEE